jgi:endonuclease YncB( thermonuclease family)
MAAPMGATPEEQIMSSVGDNTKSEATTEKKSTGPKGAKLVEGPKGAKLATEESSDYNSGGSARGKVIEVHDGDTVTVQDNEDGHKYTVRLSSIDAPELKQKFGKDAQKYLSDKILNQEVDLSWDKLDQHGRYLGKINHKGEDVNFDLVKGGFAHHYGRYDKSSEYTKAAENAIQQKLGLWKDDKHPKSPEAFRRDAEDPTGWKRFKFKDAPAALGREFGSLADTILGVVPMAANLSGLIAETVAPVFGKDPKSVSRETDKLVEQLSDPIRKVVGGNKEKWASTGWNQTMEKAGELLGDNFVDHVADATNMSTRQKQVFADSTMIVLAELTGGLLGKLKVKDKITEKLTTPTDKERADYLERKSKADSDFAFEQKQKQDERQHKFNEEADKAKEAFKGFDADVHGKDTVVDQTTGEIKQTPSHLDAAHTEISTELGLTKDTASKLLTTDEQFGLFKSGYDSAIKAGAEKSEAIQTGLRNIYEDHVISSLFKDMEERKAAWQTVNKLNEVKTETPKGAALLDKTKTEPIVASRIPKGPLASASADGSFKLNHAAIAHDFNNGFKYIFEGEGRTGAQKQRVFEELGITKEELQKLIPDVETYEQFLIEHEKSHVANDDHANYPRKDGKLDLEHPDAIAIEKRATQDALDAIKAGKKDLSKAFKQEPKTPAPGDLELQTRLREAEKPVAETVAEAAKDAEKLNDLAKNPTKDKLAEYLKANDKQLSKARDRYFKQAGIAPIQGIADTPRSWAEMVKDAIGVNINEVIYGDHRVKNLVKAIKKIAPKAEDRVKIFEAIQRKTVDQLPEHLKAAAEIYSNTMKEWGKEFMDAGMLKGLLDNYASRIIETKGVDPSVIDTAFKAFRERMGPDLSEKSRFQKKRTIDAYDELLKVLDEHGLKLKTRDIAEVAALYGKSMWKAKANRELIKYLKEFNLVDGQKIFIDSTKPGEWKPFNYETIRGGQFDGWAVHPDIAKAMKFVTDVPDLGMFFRGMHALSMATKRLNVGASLFHATTLLVGSAFTNSIKTNNYFNPVAHYKAMAEAYSNAYSSGRLKFWNDVGGRFGAEVDAGMGAIGHLAKKGDEFLHKLGGFEGDYTQKTLEIASKPQHLLDKITWDVIHDGSKLMTMEALLEKAMRDHPNKTEAQLAKEITKHVNDVYGGLNWFEAARDSNKFLENLKMSAFSPQGLKYFQILEFAPDWTLSTLRVFGRAIPKSLLQPHKWNIAGGIQGILQPLTAGDYARRYQIQAMLYLNLVANGLNMALSGHSIYDNKDFFSIELGDGSAIHPFKHYSEAFHWIKDPSKTFINKLGFVPRMFIKTADKTWAESAKEALTSMIPFSITGAKKGVPEAIGGFVGVPMTGKHTGKLGGEGVTKNLDRMYKRTKRKLGIKDEPPKGARLITKDEE